MALTQNKLDDLTWAEMVKAIRRRVAADSNGQWTLHAPVDPGVTLLELFAWLIEQRIYRLDQIPDALVRASLRMLGKHTNATRSASTVFQFRADDFRNVPAKTPMTLARSNPRITFSTDSAITVLPLTELVNFQPRLGLFVDGKDRSADLKQGRVLRLLPADGKAGEVKIVLWLTKPVQAAKAPIGLFVELTTSKKVLPQWSPEATADVPPPAETTWSYSIAGDKLRSFEPEEVSDGTGGLRRSGVVRLPLKADWEVDQSIKPEPNLFAYSIVLRAEKTTFTVPPRLVRLVPNVAVARHRRASKSGPLQRSWLPLPGNVIGLSDLPEDKPFKDFPPIETSVRLRIKERDGVWHRWQRTDDFVKHGPADRVFTVDREKGLVQFGDGLSGRLPVLAKVDPNNPNDGNIQIRYQIGGGPSGNVGAAAKWEPSDPDARNIVAAIGGAEPETIEQVRQRVAAESHIHNRAITVDDHESIAVTTPGVAFQRAHAAIGLHPEHSCPVPGATTVFVVPDAPREETDEASIENAFVRAPQPDPGSLALARARFDRARLVTSELFVSGPRYREVALSVAVDADPFDLEAMTERVKDRLQTFLDPLTGGEQGDGWPFGEPLRPSALMRQAQRAIGDEGLVTAVNVFLEGQPPKSACADVPIGPHDLVALQDVSVNVNRSTQDQGGIR
jgi:predicted phage baseplate assembly protein